MPARRKTTATPPTRTTDEARTWLRANGITIAAFARKHGLSRDVVGDLLLGRTVGNFGDTHRAAVLLGLKPNPDSATQSPKPSRN
ncbi:DNA-binding protein [Xanthomonas nasturtii]|uniref:DNA-binding protein n=1 Tax=Xanthomonas nasturtii TaxID=1843581 RepID=UPI002012890F|nr:DNA-binding protein [Xanthomonas nasturtii]MCL1558326.1 DNA-binding protein [Xanthomonas nasturtii]